MLETKYSSSFGGWMKSLEDNHHEGLAKTLRSAYGNQVETLTAIEKMQLPVAPWRYVSLADFLAEPERIITSIPETELYDITLAPRNVNNPLYFRKKVTLKPMLQFINRKFVDPKIYDVILQKSYTIKFGGAITSVDDQVLVEMGEGDASIVTHGVNTVPYQLRKDPFAASCRYTTGNENIKQLLWQSLRPLYRHQDAEGDFLAGYFEFNLSEDQNGLLNLSYINYKSSPLFSHSL